LPFWNKTIKSVFVCSDSASAQPNELLYAPVARTVAQVGDAGQPFCRTDCTVSAADAKTFLHGWRGYSDLVSSMWYHKHWTFHHSLVKKLRDCQIWRKRWLRGPEIGGRTKTGGHLEQIVLIGNVLQMARIRLAASEPVAEWLARSTPMQENQVRAPEGARIFSLVW
jgi:hypothetical protein